MTTDSRSPTGTARALFLAAALLSFGLSVVLYFTGSETEGIFVGLWVPSILALGAFLVPRRVDVATAASPAKAVAPGTPGEGR